MVWYLLEINNSQLFLVGLIILITGSFVVIFDYPQIQYFEQMPSGSYYLLDSEKKNIHQRLLIELVIGAGIVATGSGLIIFSLVKKRP